MSSLISNHILFLVSNTINEAKKTHIMGFSRIHSYMYSFFTFLFQFFM